MIQKHKQIIPPAILTASLLLTLALIVHTVLLGGNVGSQSAMREAFSGLEAGLTISSPVKARSAWGRQKNPLPFTSSVIQTW